MRYRNFFLFQFGYLLSLNTAAQTVFIPFNHHHIRYEGRINYLKDAAELSWSGSSVTIYFKGQTIEAILKDQDTANYYNIIIDDKIISKIHTEPIKKKYTLVKALSNSIHKIELFKRTEWFMGKTWLYGFEIPSQASLSIPPAPAKRKIEFYGNSITCGYGMEDSSRNDSWHGYFENNYNSFAAITARHFKAQYHCIARSGIGVMISWEPLIMPEMYNRLDATDPGSKWDFSKYVPDIVVIDLFQNDCWLTKIPGHAQFKFRFGNQPPSQQAIIAAYKSFVEKLRSKYPHAHIICTLGNMDATRPGSPWPGYIQQAVDQLKDAKIYTLFFKFKNSPGHPKTSEQLDMANNLVDFIEKKIKW